MLFIVTLLITVLAIVASIVLRGRRGPRDVAGGAGPTLALGIAVVFAALSLIQAVRVIPAGHVGVVDFYGNVSDTSLRSGIHLVNPLARVTRMSIKTEELKELMDVPSKEGLTMQLEISVLFHLDPERAPEVYKTIGPDYVGIILEPQFRSVSRGVTAAYEAKALYTSEREQVSLLITKDLEILVRPRGIEIEATPLRKLTLPARLAQAIEEKLGAEQESQRMQFVLTKERQEADRKRIEAEGIADFQKTVSQGISDALLKWKGIEATLEISKSQNAKVVIIGAGTEGLPVILGGP